MESFALDAFRKNRLPSTHQWIGVYQVQNVEVLPEGVRFLVKGAKYDRDFYGFYYAAKSVPLETPDSSYIALSPPWYIWQNTPHLGASRPIKAETEGGAKH
jgi:hypothetical protein